MAGADQLHISLWARADAAVLHAEMFAFEITAAGGPQVAQNLGVFSQVFIEGVDKIM
ncbi:hypothetical protein PsgB076_05048 [Pseudomonas savastanoi pv. glycinea str. B076]|nr:hypothetical protein PsgB076_05048 [Pseudomonas savastanoi pv. glycinea str. B076]